MPCFVGNLWTPDHIADFHSACTRRFCALGTGIRHLTAFSFHLTQECILPVYSAIIYAYRSRFPIASSGLLLHAWLQCKRWHFGSIILQAHQQGYTEDFPYTVPPAPSNSHCSRNCRLHTQQIELLEYSPGALHSLKAPGWLTFDKPY